MFDEYFSGTLNEQEKLDLDSRLKTDMKLEQAFQEYRNLRNGIDYSIMNTLKEELQELEATLPEVQIEPQIQVQVEEPKVGRHFVLLKVAAIVMLIAVSAVVVFQLQQPSSPQDLFTQYFEPYPNEFVSAKRGDDIAADPIVQAFQTYDNQNYKSAIDRFTKILDEEANVMVLFYLGNAQLAQHVGGPVAGGVDRSESQARARGIVDERLHIRIEMGPFGQKQADIVVHDVLALVPGRALVYGGRPSEEKDQSNEATCRANLAVRSQGQGHDHRDRALREGRPAGDDLDPGHARRRPQPRQPARQSAGTDRRRRGALVRFARDLRVSRRPS